MADHAVFSPSASERWIACPASHLRSKALPPAPPSVYSDRGNLLHKYAAFGVLNTLARMDELAYRDGVVFEDDERAALAVYVKFAKRLRTSSDLWGVEQRVSFSPELFGTIDFFAVRGSTLHIVDFKSGRGVYVDAVDNSQLLIYAMLVYGLFDQIGAVQATPAPERIELHIVQPLYTSDAPIRSVSYTRAELLAWRATVQNAMQNAKQADAPFHPGTHCRFCPVKPTCPALRGMAAELPAPLAQDKLTPVQIGDWLGKADTIEGWIAALREHAHSMLAAGAVIPGWKLVDKRAIRKWKDEDAVLATAQANRIHAQELKLLSPTQLEKKYRQLPPVLAPFVDQTPSGKNLVRDPATAVAPVSEAPKLEAALMNLQYRV